MIKFNDYLQCFECRYCGYRVEVQRYIIADQNKYMRMRERLESVHKECKDGVKFKCVTDGQQVSISISRTPANQAAIRKHATARSTSL